MKPKEKLKIALLALLCIFIAGVVGFHVIEGWGIVESFYTAVVTLLTVGYGDFYPHTNVGRVFTALFIIVGVCTMLLTIGLLTEAMVEARFKVLMGRGKVDKTIRKMRDHYIICGCGRIGYLICRELYNEKFDFVVIDNNPEVIQRIEEEGFIYYKGDATQEKTLLAAGIERAKGIACVLPSDAENLYIILTAKELNPDIYILSRAIEEGSEQRLLRAGAHRVMSPYVIGGMRMAMAILRPAMLDFIEITTMRQSLELKMEEVTVHEGSPIIGKSLEESEIRQRFGLIIVAVKKDTGKMIFNPLATYVIERGDKLIAMGEGDSVVRFAHVCMVGEEAY